MKKRRVFIFSFCALCFLVISTSVLLAKKFIVHEHRQNRDIEQLQIDSWDWKANQEKETEEFFKLWLNNETEINGFFKGIQLNAYQKLALGEDISLLVVGDSIGAQPWTLDVSKWIEKNYRVNCDFTNISLGGNTSFAGFVSEKLLKDGIKYDLVIICYGQNDDTAEFLQDYEALIRETIVRNETKCIIPILESSQREYNEKMRCIINTADHYDLTVADLIEAYKSSGYSYEALTGDGVHPNEFGQEIYAQVIEGIISSEVKKENDRRNMLINTAMRSDRPIQPADYEHPLYVPDYFNSNCSVYENFRYIPSEQFIRLSETEWEIELDNISGVLGLCWARCYQTNQFEIFLNDTSIYFHEDYFRNEYTLKKIDRLFDETSIYNGMLRIVFSSKECADCFTGIVFIDYKDD